jgi:hypothetical protein
MVRIKSLKHLRPMIIDGRVWRYAVSITSLRRHFGATLLWVQRTSSRVLIFDGRRKKPLALLVSASEDASRLITDPAFRRPSQGDLPPAVELDTALAKVDIPEGRRLAKTKIERQSTPIYGTDPAHPGFVVQQRSDGTTHLGKFVNLRFKPSVRRKGRDD